ncbi:hypothetical protein FA15DRAFT_731679 [Coprinopsis marcescibilis]|uniref:CxC2-like cysteine cluster KDZ transposase-associated domain-containing protein n=1 Tax=Coprinopsis marcescibilis TaxID=230819 RepID=A0A5C3KDD7_COPMA|nr:hypothetical protein FA15DRAFT_731679 [Coprinopsis marcescibilis]
MLTLSQSDIPFLAFIPEVDCFLNEFLRLESPAGESKICFGCLSSIGTESAPGYSCRLCFATQLRCKACVVKEHSTAPFHFVQEWKGSHFEPTSLKKLGLRVQLGHVPGQPCPRPLCATGDEFVVVHIDGISQVGLDFCGCPSSPPHVVQLLRHRLFPATVTNPLTAATFNVLETFQMLSFTSKCTPYEFVRALVRRTNNSGMVNVPDRYASFLRMIHVWRHIRLLKRSGVGHLIGGSGNMKSGDCALHCPACPRPGINIPKNWKNRALSTRFLYRLFMSIDANFRLKRRDVSSDERDPGLNHGIAYVVEEKKFRAFLEEHGNNIQEKSTCSNYDAIKSAHIRGGKGLAASGLGLTICSRHELRRPLGCGDLQKGERYVNMDYILLSTLKENAPELVTASYDIGCQYGGGFEGRCDSYPEDLNPFDRGHSFLFLVPKFHLPAHVLSCQPRFSFNYTPGVGRTDGEAPERNFSLSNELASSTKEMGPGSRRDTLDDHFGDMNWTKIVSITSTLKERAKEAIKMRRIQVDAFLDFTEALPKKSVTEWTNLVWDWESDPEDNENPFVVTKSVLSAGEVRRRLAEEDAAAIASGDLVEVHADVTPSAFIRQGIEIEETQRKFAADQKGLGTHSTDIQRARIIERSNSLQRRIDAWFTLQALFMPQAVAKRRARQETDGPPDPVYAIPLFLPSALCGSANPDTRLIRCEQQYRIAQAETTLQQLRNYLLFRSHMYNSQKRYSRGTRMSTQSNATIQTVTDNINTTATKYRQIRATISNLSSVTKNLEWERNLKPLEEADVRGLTSDADGGEGSKKLTWIWTTAGTGDDEDEITQSDLRIEWCKSRARAHRWQEECMLLSEELRRVLVTFEWEATEWDDRASLWLSPKTLVAPTPTLWNNVPEIYQREVAQLQDIRNGKVAYARRQASIRRAMIKSAKDVWGSLDTQLGTFIVNNSNKAKKLVECTDIPGDEYTGL